MRIPAPSDLTLFWLLCLILATGLQRDTQRRLYLEWPDDAAPLSGDDAGR